MSTAKHGSPHRRSGWVYGIAALAVVGAAGTAAALLLTGPGGDGVGNRPIFTVQEGPLTISVTESGTIQALDQVVLKSQVEGRTTIIYLIEEGVHVKKGDLLVELDASALMDQRLSQQISVQNAEAAFIRAEQTLEVTRSQGQSDIAQAELDYQFAQEDLAKYVEGEYPMQLQQAQTKITLAEEEFKRATDVYAGSRRLFEANYLSATELASDELTKKRRELELDLARRELELLVKYTNARQLTELQSRIEQTKMALERVQLKAAADLVQANAELRAKRSEFNRQQDRLAKVEDQISKCRIVAPTDGMVIYATTGQASYRGNAEPLAEGKEVREREELITLPTARSMMAQIKVHESSLDKVALGQPVRITIDALPGRVFSGKVTRISPLPDGQSVWLNPDLKVYSTDIVLDYETPEIRTGMSCQAQIIVDHYPSAVQVPVQSVMRVGGQPTAYVVASNQILPRSVELGLDNNQMVRILNGLEPGDRVLLAPPLASGAAGPVAVGESDAKPEADEAAAGSSPSALLEQARGRAAAEPGPAADAASPAAGDEAAAPARGGRNLTPEQREARRERMQNMTPEQQQAFRQQRQAQRQVERPAEGGTP